MLRFSKYSGAGNDFVIMSKGEAPVMDLGTLAQRVCQRRTGVGVDGLILVRKMGADRLEVRYFNPDGSEFSTCGNGTRCVARWATDQGLTGREIEIVTPVAEIRAIVEDSLVSLDYRIDARVQRRVELRSSSKAGTAWLVRVGVPHLVLPLETMPQGPIEELCRPIRHHPDLGADGANVNLVSLQSPGEGMIRTFERGIEGETAACGSGAMACALALHAIGKAEPELALTTHSGETLRITLLDEIDDDAADPEPASGETSRGEFKAIRLAGPVRHILDGTFAASLAG
jgi:diaminopimelate epimerase